MVTHTNGGLVAVIMLFMFNGVVFAGVQFAITIMRLAGNDDSGGGKRQPVITGELAAVKDEASAQTRRP